MLSRYIESAIQKIFMFFNIRLTEKQFRTINEFIKFCIVGASNSLVYYIFYFALMYISRLFSMDSFYIVAHSVSFVISVFWSYFWNRWFVFPKKDNVSTARTLIKTFIAYLFTGLILNNVLLIIWIQRFQISVYISPLINLLINVPVNFVINKFWSFRK